MTKQQTDEKEIERWIKKKNRDDIKKKLNPIYSIKTGSWYKSEEMFEDVEDLMIAVGTHFYNKGKTKATKSLKAKVEELKEENNEIEKIMFDSFFIKKKDRNKKTIDIIKNYNWLQQTNKTLTKQIEELKKKIKELEKK